MTNPTFRALCAELVATWDKDYPWDHVDDPEIMGALLDRARAELAKPEPAPTDEALLECAAKALGYKHIPKYEDFLTATADELLVFARAALARWGTPAIQPIVVPSSPADLLINRVTYLIAKQFSESRRGTDCTPFARAVIVEVAAWFRIERHLPETAAALEQEANR